MSKVNTKEILQLMINEELHVLFTEPQWTLSQVLREQLGLTACKEACGEGACGACTVIIDGIAIPSCMILAIDQKGKSIETVEGLEKNGVLHPIQEAWIAEYGAQCGFCSPGMIMTAKALLDKNDNPSIDEIKDAMAGNVCLCGNYEHIIGAVQKAASKIQEIANAI